MDVPKNVANSVAEGLNRISSIGYQMAAPVIA